MHRARRAIAIRAVDRAFAGDEVIGEDQPGPAAQHRGGEAELEDLRVREMRGQAAVQRLVQHLVRIADREHRAQRQHRLFLGREKRAVRIAHRIDLRLAVAGGERARHIVRVADEAAVGERQLQADQFLPPGLHHHVAAGIGEDRAIEIGLVPTVERRMVAEHLEPIAVARHGDARFPQGLEILRQTIDGDAAEQRVGHRCSPLRHAGCGITVASPGASLYQSL